MWCMWYVYHIYIYIYIIYIYIPELPWSWGRLSCCCFFTRGFGAVLSWPHLAWALQEPLSSVPLVVVSVTELNPWHGVGLSCIHFQIWNHFVKVNLERLGYTLKKSIQRWLSAVNPSIKLLLGMAMYYLWQKGVRSILAKSWIAAAAVTRT